MKKLSKKIIILAICLFFGGSISSTLAQYDNAGSSYVTLNKLAGLDMDMYYYNSMQQKDSYIYYTTIGQANDISNHWTCLPGKQSFKVVDISNPLSPTQVGGLDINGCGQGLIISGNYAYTLNNGWQNAIPDADANKIDVIDISNPAAPFKYETLHFNAVPMAIKGHYLYAADWDTAFDPSKKVMSLDIIDISD